MKSIKKLLCLTACAVGFVSSVNAATIAIGNDSTTAGARNRSVPLELRDDDLSEYSKVEFRLAVSETSYANISFNYTTTAGMTFTPNGDVYVIENASGLHAVKLGDINYSTTENLTSNFKIVLNDVKFTKKDSEETAKPGDANVKKIDGTITYEKAKSTEATLSSLSVSQGELSPEFSSMQTEYAVQVKDTINRITINANPCAGATRVINGPATLEMGENIFEIEVTAEDETTKNTYTVRVIRGEIAEPSAYLKKLEINNIGISLSPQFDPKNNKYTVQIGKDINKLDFKYETEYPLAKVDISGNENFQEGENEVKIKVSTEGVETQIYEITVIKEEEVVQDVIEEPKDEEKEEKKNNNVWLIVTIVVVIVAVACGVAFLLFKKKKSAKKDETKLPLKKRDEPKKSLKEILLEDDDEEENSEDKHTKPETDSVTDILKSELYDETKTHQFDSDELANLKRKIYEEDDIAKTKEFDFKDFE